MAHVRTYNPSVRVGNWNEDIQLEEDCLKDFLERRDKGQLLIQKSQGLIGKMMNPVNLSTSSDGTVKFGDTVMVVNRGNPDRTVYGIGQYPRDDSALAMHMSGSDAEQEGDNGPLSTTGTKQLTPCFRTAFKVMPADQYTKKGDRLRYCQPFLLETAAEGSGPRYLYSDKVLFSRCAEKSRNQIIQLVNQPSFQTWWQIDHKNPLIRMEYENEPVMANEECIIKHSKTHQNLCVEEMHFIPTFQGKEYEISANTSLDSHKADEPRTRWSLVLAVAGDPNYPLALNRTGDQCPANVKTSV